MDVSKAMNFIGKYKYIIVVIAVGFLFMSFPSKKRQEVKMQSIENDFQTDEFEKRIEKALAVCEGVGRAEVILSVDSGPERVYAKEARKSTKEQNDVTENDSDTKPSILSEGSGRESPVLIKEIYPEFRGAMVICDGADSVGVRMEVTEAVASLTGLSSDRISVVKMKKAGG